MFDNTLFENWLDEQANEAMQKVVQGVGLSSNEMMILVLKAQTNHIAHLDQDLRHEMIALRQDMDKRFEQGRQDMDRRFEQMQQDMDKRFDQVDRRFEQVQQDMDKRFDQVDRRFEQVRQDMDKRFDMLTARMDSFMRWSFATTLTVGGLVIGVLKFWPAG